MAALSARPIPMTVILAFSATILVLCQPAVGIAVRGASNGAFVVDESQLRFNLPIGADSAVTHPSLGMTSPPPPYNPDQALDFLYYSAISSCSAEQVMNFTCKACKIISNDVKPLAYIYNSTLELAAWVGQKTDGTGIVAFRGTITTLDWIEDFEFNKVVPAGGCPSGCGVHYGFFTAFLSLRRPILEVLQSAGVTTLEISGHSLGAAMSNLAAYDFSTQFTITNVINFGSPRVGNQVYADYFKTLASEYRVVNAGDPVPHLPPTGTLLGIKFDYHAVATEVFYPTSGNLTHKVCDGSGEDPTCSDSVPIWDWNPSDHTLYLDQPIGHLC